MKENNVQPNNTNAETIPVTTQLEAGDSARQKLQDELMKLVREMPSDWRTMSEEVQERFISRIDAIAEGTIKGIIRHLATDGRKVIRTTIESLQVKDSLKVTLTAQKTNENVADIGNSQGSWCYLVTYDEKNNLDAKRPKADPNEPALIDEDE